MAGQATISHSPIESDGLFVNGDGQRLVQMLLASLDKAIRYAHPGGRVHTGWQHPADDA